VTPVKKKKEVYCSPEGKEVYHSWKGKEDQPGCLINCILLKELAIFRQ
jgi:hypothetical protein